MVKVEIIYVKIPMIIILGCVTFRRLLYSNNNNWRIIIYYLYTTYSIVTFVSILMYISRIQYTCFSHILFDDLKAYTYVGIIIHHYCIIT